jgi:hypothetical protein
MKKQPKKQSDIFGTDLGAKERQIQRLLFGIVAMCIIALGIFLIHLSLADGQFFSTETESGVLSGPVSVVNDTGASAQKAILFAAATATQKPTVTLTASPTTVTSGQTSTLTWTSANATACTATGGWSGSKATSGSAATSALTATSSFTLSCTGSGGSASANATVTVSGTTAGNPVPTGPTGVWTLTFDDEFNGTSLDMTKWSPNWFGEGGKMNNVGTFSKNVSVSSGTLNLQLSTSTVSGNPADGALVHTDYTAGRYQMTVGSYTEARVYFPGSSTEQIFNWPGWWISGQNWPRAGEHDIFEGLGGDPGANYHGWSGTAEIINNSGTIPGTWNNAFHTYGVYRKATSADVYWDGRLIRTYTTSDNGGPEELIFNAGASGSRTPQLGAAGMIKVDWVRAWKAN